jgi:hypothetical protein
MKASPNQGENRTGFLATAARGEEMVKATREFLPSSPGTADAIADVRIGCAQEGEPLGEMAPPAGVIDKAKSMVSAATGGQPTLLLDKLGARLAFEHAGARLYEALISKHEAFAGGPEAQDLLHILQEEYEHADLLRQAIKAVLRQNRIRPARGHPGYGREPGLRQGDRLSRLPPVRGSTGFAMDELMKESRAVRSDRPAVRTSED